MNNKINKIKKGGILEGLNVLLVDNGSDTINDYFDLLKNHKVNKIS